MYGCVALATQDTIRAWQSFWKAPDASHQNGQVLSLLSIGSGVNGHIDTCHGGFVSLLVDEALGLAAENSRPADKTTMTAYLHVSNSRCCGWFTTMNFTQLLPQSI